jgi:hypothetical protein
MFEPDNISLNARQKLATTDLDNIASLRIRPQNSNICETHKHENDYEKDQNLVGL